jgi:hypothetical protein
VDKAALVEAKIAAGRTLIEALDRRRFGVTSAFWYYDQDADDWILMISSPEIGRRGPIWAYSEIRSVLEVEGLRSELDLGEIKAVRDDDPIVGLLRSALRVPGIGHLRFTRNVINGVYVPDAYIYRTAEVFPAG